MKQGGDITDSKNCGKFICELRKEHNLTQKELAEKLNVSDKAVSRWETGKGFPDVNSLLALSEAFGISVNELLAGKRIEKENFSEIAEKNVINAIETTEKSVKKKKLQMIICSAFFLILLLPAAIPTFAHLFNIIASAFSIESIEEVIGLTIVAVLLLASGFAIKKGNISLLHSYHYKNVVDREGYCRAMGKTTMLMSIPTFICAFTALFPENDIIQALGTGILITGYIICVAFLFKYQYKYNGGLF